MSLRSEYGSMKVKFHSVKHVHLARLLLLSRFLQNAVPLILNDVPFARFAIFLQEARTWKGSRRCAAYKCITDPSVFTLLHYKLSLRLESCKYLCEHTLTRETLCRFTWRVAVSDWRLRASLSVMTEKKFSQRKIRYKIGNAR